MLQDCVVPRSKLPEIVALVQAIGARHGVLIANVFHAGDGNLHPAICYDERTPGQFEAALAANEEILDACSDAGGVVTGEHGIGMDLYRALKRTLDPAGILNPGKMGLAS